MEVIKKFENKKLLQAKFTRKEENLALQIKVAPEIENFFKTEETRTSEVYRNTQGTYKQFYKLTEEKERILRSIEQELNIKLTEYGGTLFDGRIPNLSVLRTVEISNGIEIVIEQLLSVEQMKLFLQKLKETVAYIYKKYIKPVTIKVEMTIEEVI